MDDDFFHSEAKPEEEEFHGYSEMQEHTQQTPEPTFAASSTAMGASSINNPQINYDEPLQAMESSAAEADEALERIRKDEEALMHRLRLKAEEEADLKRKRKEKGARQLQEHQSEKERQVEANRVVYRQNANNLNTQNQKYRSPWQKVADNIALKEGDYPGTKNVSRMRDVIISKKQDDLQKK